MLLIDSLHLSIDSLIVSAALSAAVPRRHAVPLIALFGICDVLGSMLHPALAPALAGAGFSAAIFLVAWGSLLIAGFPAIARWCRSPVLAYLLPPLMAIDNALVPGASPVLDGITSSVMAALGFAVGWLLLARLASRQASSRWRGALLTIAGFLLLGL